MECYLNDVQKDSVSYLAPTMGETNDIGLKLSIDEFAEAITNDHPGEYCERGNCGSNLCFSFKFGAATSLASCVLPITRFIEGIFQTISINKIIS